MAAQKKGSKPAPKQTAAKKKPAQKPAQAAKKNTKQQKPQSKPPQSNAMTAVRERENRRFWSYILFFFGILELLITFVEGDGLWKWLHELNRGLFGVTVFLFAPMIIYVALMIASDVTHNKVIAKVVEGSVLMLLISGMAQIIQVGSVDGSSFWLKLVGLFNDGKQLRGGGLASALLGWPLLSLFKRVGAGIVIVLVAFTFIMLLTNVTLPQLLKAVSKPFIKSYEAVNEERIERAAQPPKPPREKKEPRRNGSYMIVEKYREGRMMARSVWWDKDTNTEKGTLLVKELMEGKVFDYPKTVEMLMKTIEMGTDSDEGAYVLDFFSGSGTTAHAVMQLNAKDGGNRKFIMVQLPERTDEKSEAYKAGYKNICEIGKERIRRAGRKIKEDSPLTTQDLDIGFRVLKCDTSNMKEVYYNPAEYEASLFPRLEDNIKEDRTPEDLLFQVMLDLGVLLSSKIEETTIAGKKVFNVEDNYLIACFDSNVTEETIKAIAKQKPYYFVMRDSSMANDSVATNFDQIFATYSPDTVRKVL